MLDLLYLTEFNGQSRLSKYRSEFRDEPSWNASICLDVCVWGGGSFLYVCVCVKRGGDFWDEGERIEFYGHILLHLQLRTNYNTCPIWLVGCFGFNGPLRQYFSLYRTVSQREGERGEKR